MFLKLLEKERTKRGWKQDDVAKRIGVARSTYANYEKGKREPDFDTAQKLADLFETTIDYLLGESNKLISEMNSELDLTDDELISKYNVTVDGVPLAEKDLRDIISYVRVKRTLK